MLIKRKSIVSNKKHERDIMITDEEYSLCLAQKFTNVDAILPHLSEDDKEFLVSGITPEEWEDLKSNVIGGNK